MSEQQENDREQVMEDTLPSPEEFLLRVPLYEEFNVNAFNYRKVVALQFYEGTLDAYCVDCKQTSIFQDTATYRNYTIDTALSDRVFQVQFTCTRNRGHRTYFIFKVQSGVIQKIGQYPSIADFQYAQIGKYRKILGNEKYKEFSKGVGLSAHGVGIGSFVYLRRIFEELIEEAHKEAAEAHDWNEEQFARGRMDEKILLL